MMTLAQSLAVIMMKQFDLSPQLNGIVMSTNGIFQIVNISLVIDNNTKKKRILNSNIIHINIV